jgi:hypothetical protein
MSYENPFFQEIFITIKGKTSVSLISTGVSPVMVDFGLIKSVAFKVEPHFHIGRQASSSLPHFGQVPITKRSAKN